MRSRRAPRASRVMRARRRRSRLPQERGDRGGRAPPPPRAGETLSRPAPRRSAEIVEPARCSTTSSTETKRLPSRSASAGPSVDFPAPMNPTRARWRASAFSAARRFAPGTRAWAATKSPSASPPNFSRAARASSHATAASATTASASTAWTSLLSTSASPGSPVARSTERRGRMSVESGFIAARTTTSSPFVTPASRPPARLVTRR